MIPEVTPIRQVSAWQRELAEAITDPAELLALLGLGPEWLPGAVAAARLFPLRVPRAYAARMASGDPRDPLLRQVLPLAPENFGVPGFGPDPVGDSCAQVAPGVLRKYQGRVLLTATGACAVHCRYCFRRHYPYSESNGSAGDWSAAIAHIASDDSLHEVILSGGDPLMLSNRRLEGFFDQIAGIAHVQRIRIHTRVPIVLPSRVDNGLVSVVAGAGARHPLAVVVHCNHAREIDGAVRDALERLRRAGAVVLNQSVLLNGVNDSIESLADLSETLFSAGVVPYYLHLLDRVQGAAHFEVPEEEAVALHAAMRARLPGYLVPRLVREVAGAPGKQPVF